MNTLQKFRLSNIVAAVAIAGLSLSSAYAVPSYEPDPATPANAGDSGADLGDGLALIEAKLVGATLKRGGPDGVPTVNPTLVQFKDAVLAAVTDATDADTTAKILRSALYIGPGIKISKTKDIVQLVMSEYLADSDNYSAAGAQQILNAAISVRDSKPVDIMSGLILAIGSRLNDADGAADQEAAMSNFLTDSFTAAVAGAADTPADADGMVEALVESALKNAKPGNALLGVGYDAATLNENALQTIKDMMETVATGANAKHLVTAAARGVTKGIKAINLQVSYLEGFNKVREGLVAAEADFATTRHAVMGLVRPHNALTTIITDAKAAFADDDGTEEINAMLDGYLAIFNTLGGNLPRQGKLTELATANPDYAASFAIAAVHVSAGLAVPAIDALYPVAGVDELAILTNIVRAVPEAAGKSAGKAVTLGLPVSDAFTAALSNTFALNVTAVATEITKATTPATTTATELVTDAINALEEASVDDPENDLKFGVVDAVGAIMKIRKLPIEIAEITTAAFAAADTGTGAREQVAAALGRGENKVDHSLTGPMQEAIADYSPEEQASVLLAEEVARRLKTTPLTGLAVALEKIRTVPTTSLGGVIAGAGATNPKLIISVLSHALRQGGDDLTSDDKARLLNLAKAADKKEGIEIQLAFDTVNMILAAPDDLFDIANHQAIKFPKLVSVVAGAAASASPGHAHYVARALGGVVNSSTVAAVAQALFDGADMNAVEASNPSAAAALSAALVQGIDDQKITNPLILNKLNGAAVSALVKAAVLAGNKGVAAVGTVPASGTFRGVNLATGAAPTEANQMEYGSAAVVTGLVSISTADTDIVPSAALTEILKAVGKALGKVIGKSQWTVAAQAAAQAAVKIAGEAYDVTLLANAIYTGATGDPAAVLASHPVYIAAQAGKAEALAGNNGAGAAGVSDYVHKNFNNSAVTDIAGF